MTEIRIIQHILTRALDRLDARRPDRGSVRTFRTWYRVRHQVLMALAYAERAERDPTGWYRHGLSDELRRLGV